MRARIARQGFVVGGLEVRHRMRGAEKGEVRPGIREGVAREAVPVDDEPEDAVHHPAAVEVDDAPPVADGRSAFEPYQPGSASSSTLATCHASRAAPSAIWRRQLVPLATIRVSRSAARTAGSRPSSAIAIDVS